MIHRVIHRLAVVVSLGLLLGAVQSPAQDLRVLQTNSRDGSVHVIDPWTAEVVDRIDGIPINHGIAASADGTRIYVSSEADEALYVVDAATMETIRSVELSDRPHNISLMPDGSKVYVGIISQPGAINVVDTETFDVEVIPHDGGIHNIYVTPDGRHVVAGSIAGRKLTVLDTSTDEVAWAWEGEAIRPVTISANADGSTDKLYVQVSGHHGFVVVDFDTHEELARVTLPSIPEEDRAPGTYNGAPAHGIGVSPGGETVWSTSRMNSHVYVYSAYPDLELVASIPVGTDPDWVTFTPDGSRAFVANAISNDVSVIDMETFEEVARVPVGEAPKRNTVIALR